MKNKYYLLLSILILFFLFPNKSFSQDRKTKRLVRKIEKKLKKWDNYFLKWSNLGQISIDSVSVLTDKKEIQLFFNDVLSYVPVREKIVNEAKKSLKKRFGFWLRKYNVEIFSNGKNIKDFIPNLYRKNIEIDSNRFTGFCINSKPIISKKYLLKPEKGLLNRNLAVWHSHGKYYEAKLDRWEWQRARLHSTVEDIFPMTFVLDYLEPMLENAGANVFIPRERDINPNEVIVDNDRSFGNSNITISNAYIDTVSSGFKWKDTLFNSENPFEMGTYLSLIPKENNPVEVKYLPEIPQNGEYAVYISYGKSAADSVNYKINYAGGTAEFIINQTQGFGTWIYLGKFYFKKGLDKNTASIVLSSNEQFTIDAVKIGGGYGNVARRPSNEIVPKAWSLKGAKKDFQNDKKQKGINPEDYSWKTSGLPRYLEAARYYLQYCGIPDSIVYSLSKGKNDYNDDYKSRGEWVNYLIGKPNGPTDHNEIEGLGIPIDMALAFHTDAGVAPGDSIIGTLAIYNSEVPDTVFPLKQSKMVNRDLVDIVQTQIVDDIRSLSCSKWTRRGIWDKPYSEAWRANTPMMLLELMSHQNLADMHLGLDHRFKFNVSRAIYKGILKFLAYQNHFEYIVQPLSVDHFSMELLEDKKIRLSWFPVIDPLEKTANPIAYKVYMRKENEGFNQGVLVKNTFFDVELDDYDKIYSFKIAAINQGGESFPSEILSVGIKKKSKFALVVNAFDRISAPSIIDDKNMTGIAYWKDMGVPYKHEIGVTGEPYEFDRNIAWSDDDSPGWGASYSDWEGKEIAGNSFDFPYIHGKAIMKAGYSFLSTSDESFTSRSFNIQKYSFVDLIFGEEKTIETERKKDFAIFTNEMMSKIRDITEKGANIFISGAYIGTELIGNKKAESFANDILHYKWRTNHASKSGEVYSTDYIKKYFNGNWKFNTTINNHIYMVEIPDGIEPVGTNALTAFRYRDTGISAGVLFRDKYKIVALGFPFETILEQKERTYLMKQIIEFFK